MAQNKDLWSLPHEEAISLLMKKHNISRERARAFSFSKDKWLKDQGQSRTGLSSEIPNSAGDIRKAGKSQQSEHEITKSSHELMSVTNVYLGTVFIKSDIAYPMRAVFNTPMLAFDEQQVGRRSLLMSKGSDTIMNFP